MYYIEKAVRIFSLKLHWLNFRVLRADPDAGWAPVGRRSGAGRVPVGRRSGAGTNDSNDQDDRLVRLLHPAII